MMVFKQLSIIFFIYLLGEAVSLLLPFSFPGSIIGMLLLFIALLLKWIKIEDIKQVSDFLLKHMALFFIPAGVSVMSSFALIQAYIIPISLTLILSCIFMLAFISLSVDYLVKRVKDA
jgi:holin-like protein